jgi:cyclopropane-fatty-acyl-phospholipid synthase
LLALLQLALANEAMLTAAFQGKWYGKLFYRLKHWQNRNTKRGSAKNIHAHYDLGNDFYQLWLDPSMTYSSAWFEHPDMSLEDAQITKYARLFDWLEVKAGDRVLEIGCGWGGFAEYAAKRGVHVTGVSLSKEQLSYARARLTRQGLGHLADLRYQDYRDICTEQPFDAIVSIEMIEAVGESYWPSYFAQLSALVKRGGKIGLQAITIDESRFEHYRHSTDFIQQYIFPGGMLASPTRLKHEVETVGLTWERADDFGFDYAQTLKLWREKFEQTLPQIRPLGFDEGFIRIWRFYYIYCEAGFLSRRTSVYQLFLSKH